MESPLCVSSGTFFVFHAPINAKAAEEHDTPTGNEILTGEISDIDSLIPLAEAQMNSPLSDDGITANINDNGQLQIIQIVNSNTRSGDAGIQVAASTFLVVDANGDELNYTDYRTSNGGLNSVSVFAVHTTYYTLHQASLIDPLWAKCYYMTTKLVYGTQVGASSMYQCYQGYYSIYDAANEVKQSNSISSPQAGILHTYFPMASREYKIGSLGQIVTFAHINIGTQSFEVRNTVLMNNDDWTQIIS